MRTKNANERVADVARECIYALANDDDWKLKCEILDMPISKVKADRRAKKTEKNK